MFYAPTGLDIGLAADDRRGGHDAQVSFDGVAGPVVNQAGSQVVLGHPKSLLDPAQLVIDVDDERREPACEVGGLALQSGQRAGLDLQLAVDALGGTGGLDEPVALDRGVPDEGTLGFRDLLINAAQRESGPKHLRESTRR